MTDKLLNRSKKGTTYNNTFYVGSGESIQNAINLAVAEGASTSNWYEINPVPDALLDWTEPLPPGIRLNVKYKELTPVYTRFNVPRIAVTGDDCSDTWTTASSTLRVNGVDLTPEQYAGYYGIPISWGLVGNDYDNGAVSGNRITRAQFRSAAWLRGHSIHTQGYNHAVIPTNYKELVQCVDGVRYIIDNLEDATAFPGVTDGNISPRKRIGLKSSNHFSQSGNWTGEGSIDSLAKTENWIGRGIRQLASSSCMYFGKANVNYRHFGSNLAYSVVDAMLTTGVGLRNIVINFDSILVSNPPTGSITFTNFKSFIDKIYALKVAGKINPVSIETFFAAQYDPVRDHSIVADFDSLAVGAMTSDGGLNYDTWVASGSVTVLAGTPQTVKIPTSNAYIYQLITPRRGKPINISFKARRTSGEYDAANVLQIRVNYIVGGLNNFVVLQAYTLPDSDSYTFISHNFIVPEWPEVVSLQVVNKTTNANKGVEISDIFVSNYA